MAATSHLTPRTKTIKSGITPNGKKNNTSATSLSVPCFNASSGVNAVVDDSVVDDVDDVDDDDDNVFD
jgi:hypothetical protein